MFDIITINCIPNKRKALKFRTCICSPIMCIMCCKQSIPSHYFVHHCIATDGLQFKLSAMVEKKQYLIQVRLQSVCIDIL